MMDIKIKVFFALFFIWSLKCFPQITNSEIEKWDKPSYGQRITDYILSDDGSFISYRTTNSRDSLYFQNTNTGVSLYQSGVSFYESLFDGFGFIKNSQLFIVNNELVEESLLDIPVNNFEKIDDNVGLYFTDQEIGLFDKNEVLLLISNNFEQYWLTPSRNYLLFTEQLDDSITLKVFDIKKQKQILKTSDLKILDFVKTDEEYKTETYIVKYTNLLDKPSILLIDAKEQKIKSLTVMPEIFDLQNVYRHTVCYEPNHKSVYFIKYGNNQKDKHVDYERLDSNNSTKINGNTEIFTWNYTAGNFKKISKSNNKDLVLPTILSDKLISIRTSHYDVRDSNFLTRADIFIIDKDGNENMIEKDVFLYKNEFFVSSHLPYLVYFKDDNWWSYDFKGMIKKNLTRNIDSSFKNDTQRFLSSESHYGIVGWALTKKGIYVNDKNNVWFLGLDGKEKDKITNSKGDQFIARIIYDEALLNSLYLPFNLKMNNIEESNLIINESNENLQYNRLYTIDNYNKRNLLLNYEPYRFIYVKKIKQDKYVYIKENAITSPTLELIHIDGNVTYKLPFHKENPLKRGRVERVSFITKDGTRLNGSLHYPLNWSSSQKYPIIFHLYEEGKKYSNEYQRLTYKNFNGFNKSLMMENGFFVFFPDLRYKRNEVLKYLSTDIDEYIAYLSDYEPKIDTEKMGLIGHSFGAYEVMDLISKNNKFKAAVAGSGVSDIYEGYYNENIYGQTKLSRFESVQYDSNPLYENKLMEYYNPISNVINIKTPLLLWAGDKDEIVSVSNSIMMYWALWRQKKDVELIKFKTEGHTIQDDKNQIELTVSILDFFHRKLN